MMKIRKMKGYADRFLFTRYFTFRKFFNLLRIAYEYTAKKDVLKSRPCRLMIDTCNACVLKCPLCPTGKGEKGRTKAVMGFDDFRRVIDEVKDYLYEVDLYNWGEPLLNKDIFRMIEYAHKCDIKTKISTNLNYFPKDYEKRIVSSGLDSLMMSIDGASQETYQVYRKGGDFRKVIGNIRKIVAEKKRQGSRKPLLIWQFIVMKHNEHELPKVKRMIKELGVDILKVEAVRSDMGKEIFESDQQKIEKSREWLPKDEKLSRFNYKNRQKKVRKRSCIFLWSMPVVNSNGSVSPCCSVYPEKFDFGNAFRDGLLKVWNNRFYTSSRRIVSGKEMKMFTVCAYCTKHGFIE